MSFKIREAHWVILLQYMCAHPDLARGRLSSAQARKNYNSMWAELTTKLNSVGFGQKSVEKWQKSWSDYKVNLKKKAAEIERCRFLTGGGPGTEKFLTEFELKVLSLLGDSFYKGIGVKEVGITPEEPTTNLGMDDSENLRLEILPKKKLHAVSSVFCTEQMITPEEHTNLDSETLSIEIQHERKPRTLISPVVSTRKMIETCTSKRPREQEDNEFEQESQSLLSFRPLKKTRLDVLQQPLCLEQKSQVPFRKQTGLSGAKKEPNRFLEHDNLTNLPGADKQPRRSENDNNTTQIYKETVTVLHSIDNNVSRVANNLESLVSEFKTCSAAIREVLETLKPNSN